MTKRAIAESIINMDDLNSGRVNKTQYARILFKEYPDIFLTPDSARSAVRLATASQGKKNKIKKEFEMLSTIEHGLLAVPKSESAPLPDYIFPKKHQKTLIFSDVHIPYHDEKAVVAMVAKEKNTGVDSILINGDLIDMYQASDFMKDPRMSSLDSEIEAAHCFILYLEQEFPDVPIYYKLGNHEARWEHLLMRKATPFVGMREFEFTNLLKARGWNTIPIQEDQKIKYGKLNIIHGHELKYGVYSPVNPAKGLFNKTKSNTLAGHWHQQSDHHESDFSNKAIACFSLGCLCDLRPKYSPFAYLKWNHGYGILSKQENGNFHVENKRIIEGEVI